MAGLIYNFNENSATTIRDYSENGNNGTGSNITIAASTRVGYDAVFNATTDKITLTSKDLFDGEAAISVHLAVKVQTGTGTKSIYGKVSQIGFNYNYTTNVLTANLFVASGTATVTATLTTDTFYDIDLVWSNDVLTLYIDGVSTDTDNTQSGVVDTNANAMAIGDAAGTSSGANFLLNEIQLYDSAISTDNIAALIAEQNGVYSDSGADPSYEVGDIIAADVFDTTKYGIVSWIGTNSEYRFYPISSNIGSGSVFRRVGHLWDTDRQYSVKFEDDSICWYNGVSLSTEAFTDAKKLYCLSREGVIKNSSTKTANYTIVNTDQRIYVDSSGGAFTITLEASPTTNREIEIIDSVGSCGSNAVTVDGNGNNILGAATQPMNANYDSWHLVYNGTQWNLK
jgi:hypothetical protein